MEEMTSGVQKNFREIYDSLGTTPPKTAFIERMMKVTYKSKSAVNGWLYGPYDPDALTQKVISDELGIPAAVLFPKKETKEDETR